MRLNLILVSTLFLKLILASLGDDLDEFKQCVAYCDIISCNAIDKYPFVDRETYKQLISDKDLQLEFDKLPLPWNLRLLGWKCYPNCDYQCQRIITRQRMEHGQEIYQFHGKWPFIRIYGIQEFFSTLFSIGNWFPHYWGFKLIGRHYLKESTLKNKEFANLYWSYLIVSAVAMCAWFFSTIFHLRDTWNRERLDYFFAGMTVLSGFYGITTRVFKLYLDENYFKRRVFGLICIIMYVGHVSKLLIDWSYTYNMQANVIIGVSQNILWVYHAIISFKKLYDPSTTLLQNLKNEEINWTLIPILLVLSIIFGMTFELFDFAPFFELLDAHALWHFVTIWPAIYWYPYMVKDVEIGLKDKKFE